MEHIGDLILLRGLPGSGKSTLGEIILHSFKSNNENMVISADDFFIDVNGNYNFDPSKLKEAHNDCLLRCVDRMKNEIVKIVVANTFTQEWEMESYYELAKKYGYMVISMIVENRHGGTNEHGVPADKIELMKNRFEIEL